MLVTDEPSRGDTARAVVGAIFAFLVMALLYEPTVRLFVPKLLFFSAIVMLCVVTARRKGGVLLGIVGIIILRLIIGVGLFGVRFNR